MELPTPSYPSKGIQIVVCPPGSPQGSDWQTGKGLSLGLKRTSTGIPPFLLLGKRHPFSKPQSPLFERGLLLLGLGGHPGGAQTARGWSPRSPPTPQLTLASLIPLHLATANARLKTPSEGQPASWGSWDSTTGHPGGQPGQDRTKVGGQKKRANERTTGVGGRREARRLGFKCHA